MLAMFFALCGIVLLSLLLPQQYNLPIGQSLTLPYGVTACLPDSAAVVKADGLSQYPTQLRWLGVFAVKEASVRVVPETYVVPCGTPFGIKLYTEGVLVVGMSDVDTSVGQHNPARAAGIKVGDAILSAGGTPISSMKELATLIEQTDGKPLTLRLKRDGVIFDVRFSPAFSLSEKRYKAGLWVRDSSAGIGTVTFYHLETMTFAGLGHAVCDVDTRQVLPISTGEAVRARIYSVTASKKGVPGELCGGFENGSIGTLVHNGISGLYGFLNQKPTYATPVAVAMRQQVQSGPAEIWTTVDGITPGRYTVEIQKIRYNDPSCKDMIIRITDPELLRITGGIVQGMSGSPILQNGKLVGAVTHVLIDDPQKGYAIFAERMLETAQNIAKSNPQRAAA